jgi:adenylate cyclase
MAVDQQMSESAAVLKLRGDETYRLHPLRLRSVRGMLTFRTSITFAVMAFIVALAVLLIAIQVRALRWATQEAASAYMDATSAKAFGRLQTERTAIASLVHVLATSSSVADSNERTETGHAIPLFKAALQELPQMDSVYAGFDAWLQVRRIGVLIGLGSRRRSAS